VKYTFALLNTLEVTQDGILHTLNAQIVKYNSYEEIDNRLFLSLMQVVRIVHEEKVCKY